jgi:hypothetical protein
MTVCGSLRQGLAQQTVSEAVEASVVTYATSGAFGEQSGRTTGRLGSTGLRAMPSEGWHSRLPLLQPPGLDTISVRCGPAKQLADEGRSDAALRNRRLRDRRERADASVRSTGLGEWRNLLDAACAGYLLF